MKFTDLFTEPRVSSPCSQEPANGPLLRQTNPAQILTCYTCKIRLNITVTSTSKSTRVEAGSNTSTVNLRVVRGDEMGLKKAAP
jgi:hypothetical protein